MKKEIAQKWVKALRSGQYKQGKPGHLKDNFGEYCCLGVLCEILNGEVSYNAIKDQLKTELGLIEGTEIKLASLNDIGLDTFIHDKNNKGRFTFEEIADIIEIEWENL